MSGVVHLPLSCITLPSITLILYITANNLAKYSKNVPQMLEFFLKAYNHHLVHDRLR